MEKRTGRETVPHSFPRIVSSESDSALVYFPTGDTHATFRLQFPDIPSRERFLRIQPTRQNLENCGGYIGIDMSHFLHSEEELYAAEKISEHPLNIHESDFAELARRLRVSVPHFIQAYNLVEDFFLGKKSKTPSAS